MIQLSSVDYLGDIVNLFGFSILGFAILALVSRKTLEVPFGILKMKRFKPVFIISPIIINVILFVVFVIDRDFATYGCLTKYIYSISVLIYLIVIIVLCFYLLKPVLNEKEFKNEKKKLVIKSLRKLSNDDIDYQITKICATHENTYKDWIIDAISEINGNYELNENQQLKFAVKMYDLVYDRNNIDVYLNAISGYTLAKPRLIDDLWDKINNSENKHTNEKVTPKVLEFMLQQKSEVISMYTYKSFKKNLDIAKLTIGEEKFLDLIRGMKQLEFGVVKDLFEYLKHWIEIPLKGLNTRYIEVIGDCYKGIKLNQKDIDLLKVDEVFKSVYNAVLTSESRKLT